MHVEAYMELKPQQPRYICPYGCNKLIASRTIDYHKNNGCGRNQSDNMVSHPQLKKRFYCCGLCSSEFITRPEFHSHLRIEHDVLPDVHSMEFPDRATFERFRFWLESEGGAHFRHKSGSKRRGRGKGIFLACNRSGNVSSDKNTANDRTGPFRLGFTCTAFIHATEHNDGHVSAEFCGDHYAHDARMRLPNVIKYIIAQKQMEQSSPMEIIGFLRHHFLSISADNIYAQRVCFVDTDELKTLLVSCTKKWSREGIPKSIEVWEEELIDKVGIEWPPVSMRSPHRFTEPRKPTTTEIAIQEHWPRPRVFVGKNRRDHLMAFPLGDVSQSSSGYEQHEDMDDPRFIQIEMEYEDERFVQDAQMVEEEEIEVVETQTYERHQEAIRKGNEILEHGGEEVRVGNEVIVAPRSSNDQIANEQKTSTDERILIESPGHEEVVIVDGDVDDEIDDSLQLHHHRHLQNDHHHLSTRHQLEDSDQSGPSNAVDRFLDTHKVDNLNLLLEEVEAFKHTVLKRADQISPANMKSLLIRFQTLHHSVMEKDPGMPSSSSSTVFPTRSKYQYRPGKGLERAEQDYLSRGNGDITLQPIEDELSDDEDLMIANSEHMSFNTGIWS